MINDYGKEGGPIITKLLCNFKFFGQKKEKENNEILNYGFMDLYNSVHDGGNVEYIFLPDI